MSNMKMNVIAGDRAGGYFPKINSWRFEIKVGARCSGLVSSRSYKSTNAAFEAGQRMLIKLETKQ